MDMNLILRQDFAAVTILLLALGAVLKYRTPLDNKLIPVVLFAVGFSICAIWGWLTSAYTGPARWIDALLFCGLAQGLVVTAISTWGWDAVHNLYKRGLAKKATAIEEEK